MALRNRLGAMVFERVAGPEGPQHRDRIHNAVGERWFADDRPIRTVHADSAMFIGGLRALLLQSLHPLAMAGVAGHSGYRGDPWGRLQRTSYFLAVTTFGLASDAEATVARVKGIHRRVRGVAPDGRPYAASDPHLLKWVHVAEVDSFLRTHQRYGAAPLSAADADGYLADTARVARALGVLDPPTTVAELEFQLNSYRPELQGTTEARAAARFLLVRPPLPAYARPPYAVLASAAVASLPLWARWPLRLPYVPLAESTVVRAAGTGLVRALRWIATPVPESAA
ncbi:MAG: oxygenase MpaB family protein [Jatrophihabitans sp.]|uniref:oxygenase MpaB family protein n=1 Tax=Jatrophihabitans sp. TaxID=1932789 RepID=UPI0039101474